MQRQTWLAGIVIILLWLSLPMTATAVPAQPLQADDAFQFSYEQPATSEVILKWNIAPDYYLYRDRIHLVTEPESAINVTLPAGNAQIEHQHKEVDGYTGELVIPVIIQHGQSGMALHVQYQGCSRHGFCYPPIDRTVKLNGTASLISLSQDQNQVNVLLANQHTSLLLFIFVGIGLLLSFTPCVLPMIPILTSIIIGQKKQVGTQKAFFLSLSYVLGTSMTYAAAGVVAALMGKSIQVWLQQPVMIGAGVFIFMLLGLSLLGMFDLRLPAVVRNKIVSVSNHQRSGAYAGVFVMGVLSALLVSPCVTAPLVGVLMYIATTGDVWLGAGALFAIGVGMGIPLIAVGVSAGKWLPKRGPWMEAIKKCFGLVMMGMAVWLLTRISSISIALLLYGLLLLAGCYLIAIYLPRLIGWRTLNRVVGGFTGLVGLLFVLLSFNTPWWMGLIGHAVSAQTPFVVVRDHRELDKAFDAARASGKPVLLDFYADWCESCIEMEDKVFSKEDVKQKLKDFVLIRVDLTDNSKDDQRLMEKYNIVAPPTVLLFNQKGNEYQQGRIIGAVDADEFTSRIGNFAQANCDSNSVC